MISILRDKLIPLAVTAALVGGGLLGAVSTQTLNGANDETALNVIEETPTLPAVELFAQEETANAYRRPEFPSLPVYYTTPANAGNRTVRTVVVERQAAPARATYYYTPAPRRVVSRRSNNVVYANHATTQGRYEPRRRSFWDKHRDKLTVAIGTGAGAGLGAAIGGKKGALIGALAGAGGSALYTYKIRKRNKSRN